MLTIMPFLNTNSMNSITNNYKNNYKTKNNNISYLSQLNADTVMFKGDNSIRKTVDNDGMLTCKKTVTAGGESGLHQRPSSDIFEMHRIFPDVEISLTNKSSEDSTIANSEDNPFFSPMDIVSIAAFPGDDVEVAVKGIDGDDDYAEAVLGAITTIIKNPDDRPADMSGLIKDTLKNAGKSTDSIRQDAMSNEKYAKSLKPFARRDSIIKEALDGLF